MAWLEQRSCGVFYLSFRYGGVRFKRSLGTKSKREAQSRKIRLEDTIRLVEAGRTELPADADVATFLLSEGRRAQKAAVSDLRLGDLCDRYRTQATPGKLEPSTIKMIEIHHRHFKRVMGERSRVSGLQAAQVQKYIDVRGREPGRRGGLVSGDTIVKEVSSLRSTWQWAIDAGLIRKTTSPFEGLRYPKTSELLPSAPLSRSRS